MPYANIDDALDPSTKQEILDRIADFKAQMPFLVNLTPSEKRKGLRLGAKADVFLPLLLQLMEHQPTLLPSYIDLPQLQRDIALRSDLQQLHSALATLQDALECTRIALEQEAMRHALAIYAHCRTASKLNVVGAAEIAEQLSTMMPRKGRKVAKKDMEGLSDK